MVLVTLAVFEIVFTANGAIVTMVTFDDVTLVALRLPMSHETVPADSEQAPTVEVTDTKVTPAGKTSVSTTPVEVAGPLLATNNV